MFVNKISGVTNPGFKGYQHVKNNIGETIYRFNYPYDYEKETCEIEFFRVIPSKNYNYKLIEEPIARVELKEGGVDVDIQSITTLDKEEPFAYRLIRKDKQTGQVLYIGADSGVKINGQNSNNNFRLRPGDQINAPEYTFVSRKGTTPRVQGAGYLVYPDAQRVGVKYKGFDDPNTGEIYIDVKEQKEMENVIRHFSNKTGGNLAGVEYNIDYLSGNNYKIQPANPIAGGDNKTSHHYWNKNNFQVSDDMGNIENFRSYTRKLYQNGMKYIYDGTFTSEGLEGIHFQYAMRWADKNPQTYYWFKMQGLRNSNLGLGVVPNNKENLRHRVINSPVIYDEKNNKIIENPDYKADKETYFQLYDASQVTEEQLSRLDKPIENYENLKSGNLLAINSHDDTLINYVCQINPNEYKSRLNAFIDFNKNNEKPLKLNSPDGTILVAQFSNFRIDRKTEGGFVAWDANTDMVKMNYYISGYDEKVEQATRILSERDHETQMRIRGAFEVQDMALQSGRYWTKLYKDTNVLYTAQALKGAKTSEKIDELIDKKLLPKETRINEEEITNILNGYYKLAPKGILNKDDVTIKAIMETNFDNLEFAENTVGVLSTSYFSNRATSEETLGLSRFELLKKNDPHLVEPYSSNYKETTLLFTDNIKKFADEIITKVNETSTEKLLDENGDYTEYGEYVMEMLGSSISKYAFLKSLAGDKLKTKILPNGEITYDYLDLKDKTSLKSLGINASNPQDEVLQLRKLMKKGLDKLNKSDVDYVAQSISKSISGTNVNSFRLAEAMFNKSGLGLDWRLDAAKDIVDQDAGRNGDVAFDENWDKLVKFWGRFVKAVKTQNPDSNILAELTDIVDLMRDNLGEFTNGYDNMPDVGLKFKTTPDALLKFFNETGITTEAAYSYFFTDMLKTFSTDFADGSSEDDTRLRCNSIIWKLEELIATRGIDYVRNLYTFVGNHDKPRTIHGLALDMKLFHGSLDIYDEHGTTNFARNRGNRLESMLQLANADDYNSLPIEAKLNIDNPQYFNTVSTYAVAMSQLLRNSINESLDGVMSPDEIKYLKSALVDLTNGNFKDSGKTTQIPSINLPELSSTENALREILKLAKITVTESEFQAILKRANDPNLVEQFVVQGDFDFGGNNADVGERNQKMIETILRGAYETVPSGEWDFMKYSTYSMGLAGLLRQAFIDVKGEDANARYCFLNGAKDFVKKYDRATVEANRTKLPTTEDSKIAMAKNGYGSLDIKDAVEALIEQAEYKARKDGKLGENEHFKNADQAVLNVWQNATEPAIQKLMMMMSFLGALVGIPTLFGGDELGLSGYDEKTKNVFLRCRGPLPWSELVDGIYKEFRTRIQKEINDSMSIRSREGVDALNHGTAYKMNTSDENIPAFMMQDSYGNMTVSVFNSSDISNKSRFDYFEHFGITEENREQFFADNKIESINPKNRFIPIQQNKDIDYIALGSGIALPIGLQFINSDVRDKAIYEVRRIIDEKGLVTNNLGIFKQGGKISLNSLTAKNGAMVLKHVGKYAKAIGFRGNTRNINKQYNIVTNPYQKADSSIVGEKFSVISK